MMSDRAAPTIRALSRTNIGMHMQQQGAANGASQGKPPGARTTTYAKFCEVAGVSVDRGVIDAIVAHETPAAVRALVDAGNEIALKHMLVAYATRMTITITKANHLLPAHVARTIRDVGWEAYAEALRGKTPDAGVVLTRWLTASEKADEDASKKAGSGEAPAAPARPPEARLPPPPAVAGRAAPRAPAVSHRQAPAGAINVPSRRHAETAPPASAPAPTGSRERAAAPNVAQRDSQPAGVANSEPAVETPTRTPKEHVYNKGRSPAGAVVARAALCVETVVDRHNNQTLKFEGAGPHPTDPERYHWQEKIIFYATPDEAQKILCVLLGYLDEASFNNHGENNDKYLKIKRQEDSMYCTMGEGKDRSVAVKIPPPNAARIAVLALLQFKRACYGLDESILHMILARVTAPLSKGADAKRKNRGNAHSSAN